MDNLFFISGETRSWKLSPSPILVEIFRKVGEFDIVYAWNHAYCHVVSLAILS